MAQISRRHCFTSAWSFNTTFQPHYTTKRTTYVLQVHDHWKDYLVHILTKFTKRTNCIHWGNGDSTYDACNVSTHLTLTTAEEAARSRGLIYKPRSDPRRPRRFVSRRCVIPRPWISWRTPSVTISSTYRGTGVHTRLPERRVSCPSH